jgi:hypothetical protein
MSGLPEASPVTSVSSITKPVSLHDGQGFFSYSTGFSLVRSSQAKAVGGSRVPLMRRAGEIKAGAADLHLEGQHSEVFWHEASWILGKKFANHVGIASLRSSSENN